MRTMFLLILIFSCDFSTNLPKQKAYFAPEFKTPEYDNVSLDCGYTFYKNLEATIKDFKNCNYEISYENFNAKIFINQIVFSESVDKVTNVFNLKINENLKYSDQVIESDFFDSERRIYSKLYSFVGNSPSNIQFYLTNKIDKFLTGSLFFETKPNYDSLYPNINYIKNDIKKMVSSFKWVDE